MELDQGRRLRSRERTTATQVAIVPYKRFIMTLPFCPRGHLTHAKLRVSISLTRRPASDGASPLPSPHLFCEAATFVVARTRVEIVPARLLARVVYPHCRRRHHKLEPCSLAPHRQIDDDGSRAVRLPPVAPSLLVLPRTTIVPPRSFFPFMVTTYKQRRLPSLTTNCCSHY